MASTDPPGDTMRRNGIIVTVVVCLSLIGALIYFIFGGPLSYLESVQNPCQHRTFYEDGHCACEGSPFSGKNCETEMCKHGYADLLGTSPRITSDYSCKCPAKFFGFLCDQCHAGLDGEDCLSQCDDGFYGKICDRTCFADLNNNDVSDLSLSGDHQICRVLRKNNGECNVCSGHGSCVDGGCRCVDDYFDSFSDQCAQTCPGDPVCSGHGTCQLYGATAGCACEYGWRGDDCGVKCPGDPVCSGHGVCSAEYIDGIPITSCACTGVYGGKNCSVKCPGDETPCSGHGSCDLETSLCTCESDLVEWTGAGCNCSDLLTCSGRGACEDGDCRCRDNFRGKHCLQCQQNYYGSECQLYCDPNADANATHLGCSGRGTCTVVHDESETIKCACDTTPVHLFLDKRRSFTPSYSADLNCKDCTAGFFPKVGVFEAFDTTPLGLYVPCQETCASATCNNAGVCNDRYGEPGQSLCVCAHERVNAITYCSTCNAGWFPDRVGHADACTKYCSPDVVTFVYDNYFTNTDIRRVHCNGHGSCSSEGFCVCEEEYTGDMCQIRCTSDSGTVCGGHGACRANDLQKLLQYDLENAPSFECLCDPQDPYSADARAQYAVADTALEPPPKPSYFGETCDFHCAKPPWPDAAECHAMGNCTVYPITDPSGNIFHCASDSECEITDVSRVTSADPTWDTIKGPFCNKPERPPGCSETRDCLEILTLQRPPQARSMACMSEPACKAEIAAFDWYHWCGQRHDIKHPPLFDACTVAQFCPVDVIDDKCAQYVDLSNGTSISAHMDYCYENDKKRFPFNISEEYRLDDASAALHDALVAQLQQYRVQHPSVELDITNHCQERIKKLNVVVSAVATNKRYVCGTDIISTDTCLFGTTDAVWTPFSVRCPNSQATKYANLLDAIVARPVDCFLVEDEPRHPVQRPVAYGGRCNEDADCFCEETFGEKGVAPAACVGVCNNGLCCLQSDPNCLSCNNIGQCAACKSGTTWDGFQCAGTSDSRQQTEAIALIDATCAAAVDHFPQCSKTPDLCTLNVCKDGDSCRVDSQDAICSTDGVLDCSCKFGLECVGLTFSTYKCVHVAENASCTHEARHFNWLGYCNANNPVLQTNGDGELTLTDYAPGYNISVPTETEFVNYWVRATSTVASSKYVEVSYLSDVLFRVYLHQGQIQLNEIATLQACPVSTPDCHDTWTYNANEWYRLEIAIDYTQNVATLKLADHELSKPFPCIADGCDPSTATHLSINGGAITYYDNFVFERSIPSPSVRAACEGSIYCNTEVNYRKLCSDVVRNLQYPITVTPTHDVVATCDDFFEHQSLGHSLTDDEHKSLLEIDWDAYCAFEQSVTGDFECGDHGYEHFEAYHDCRRLLEPLEGSKHCMLDALTYDWTEHCDNLTTSAVPNAIKQACGIECYAHIQEYDRCDEMLNLFASATTLKATDCDWVGFCEQSAHGLHSGVCSAVDCACNIERYEGVAGNACELHCPVSSDGSACGETTGVGRCVYTDKEQAVVDGATRDQNGDLIAYAKSKMQMNGKCDCFLSEGDQACDQPCLACNETVYDLILLSPNAPNQWSLANAYLNSPTPAILSGELVLDLNNIETIIDFVVDGGTEYNISTSLDGTAYTRIAGTSRGRYVKLEAVGAYRLGVKVSRAGQIGICDGARGVCDCLPPFTLMVPEDTVDWRGARSQRIRRVYNLPDVYNAEQEFRIRAMQGKEAFVTEYLKKATDNSPAYTTGDWKTVYRDFRNDPSKYRCMQACTHHDFILLGNLDQSSSRFNYDCNSECQGTDPDTLIPCSGHGSCRVTGQCVCDPAAYVVGVNEVTGASIEVNLGNGETIESSEYTVSKLDETGWRGFDCVKMCPGYDPTTKSMLKVCGGHGTCNDDAECQCQVGFIGDTCQFTCPGFGTNDTNSCSGHGTCVTSVISIIPTNYTVLYDGRCNGASGGTTVATIGDCLDICPEAATLSPLKDCFCSPKDCQDIEYKNTFTTYVINEASATGASVADCEYTWSAWSACDGARETRSTSITQTPTFGGTECPVSPEYRWCSIANVDCDGHWSEWSECDGQYQHRNLTITQEPVRDGLVCPITPEIRMCCANCNDCVPPLYEHIGGQCASLSARRLRSHPRATLTTTACQTCSTICLGGSCCHADYTDISNCLECTGGNIPFKFELRKDSIFTNAETGGHTYEEALAACDDQCTGIFQSDDSWSTSRGSVTQSAGNTAYEKIMLPQQHCYHCLGGSKWSNELKSCAQLPCPVGQTWVNYVGCVAVAGVADKTMQVPVQRALTLSRCEDGVYKDMDGVCRPVKEHPMVAVTLSLDENTVYETSITIGCEVWGDNIVKCPKCECFSDNIFGKWSSYTCDTCAKGYGNKQCRKQCPSYDDAHDITMCSGYGTCSMGSAVISDIRSFKDATCKCGAPPGIVDNNEMQLYNAFYTTFTTVEEQSTRVQCFDNDMLVADGKDACYHFDSGYSDCSRCELGFSGKNCRYKCDKCLMDGRCDSSPGASDSAQCTCKDRFGIPGVLWAFNCCPVGFRVTDIAQFNQISQTDVDDIAMPATYSPTNNPTTRNTADWCKACPGVDPSDWLQTGAQYKVCGGISRGECVHKDSSSNKCRCLSDDWRGPSCRCNKNSVLPFVNLATDYGCVTRYLVPIVDGNKNSATENPPDVMTSEECEVQDGLLQGTKAFQSTDFGIQRPHGCFFDGDHDLMFNTHAIDDTPACKEPTTCTHGAITCVTSGLDQYMDDYPITCETCALAAMTNGGEDGDTYYINGSPVPHVMMDENLCNSIYNEQSLFNLDMTQFLGGSNTISTKTWSDTSPSDAPRGCVRVLTQDTYTSLETAHTTITNHFTFSFNTGNVNTKPCITLESQGTDASWTGVRKRSITCYPQLGRPNKCAKFAHQPGGDCLEEIGEVSVDGNTIRYACSIDDGFYWTPTGNVVSRVGTHIPPSYFYTTDIPTTECAYGEDLDGKPCTRCNNGHYQPLVGQTTCLPCTVGKYSPRTGIFASCTACPAGEVSLEGSFECTKCNAGKFRGTSVSQCETCPAGKYTPSGGSYAACLQCPRGYKFKSNAPVGSSSFADFCEICEQGHYDPGDNQCHLCPSGQGTSGTGSHSCSTCATKRCDYGTSCNQDNDCCGTGWKIQTCTYDTVKGPACPENAGMAQTIDCDWPCWFYQGSGCSAWCRSTSYDCPTKQGRNLQPIYFDKYCSGGTCGWGEEKPWCGIRGCDKSWANGQ